MIHCYFQKLLQCVFHCSLWQRLCTFVESIVSLYFFPTVMVHQPKWLFLSSASLAMENQPFILFTISKPTKTGLTFWKIATEDKIIHFQPYQLHTLFYSTLNYDKIISIESKYQDNDVPCPTPISYDQASQHSSLSPCMCTHPYMPSTLLTISC